MRQDSTTPEGSLALAATAVPSTAAGRDVLPGAMHARLRLALPRVRLAASARAGRVALTTMLLCTAAVVVFASGRSGPLVPGSDMGFPGWEAGPLHYLLGHPHATWNTLNLGFSAVLLAMLAAYAVAGVSVRHLSLRAVLACVVVLHVILFLGPPLQLTDLFNYLGYSRLGALHHLNPYLHGIGTALHDPVYRLTSWHHLSSPYGPLFTALSYPLAWLPLPVAYWLLKLVVVLMSLAFITVLMHCARVLGRDPRYAVVFVALNPIYLIYAVGGFHNDFFMLVPSMAAVALVLSGRERSAGAMLMLAVTVKFTAVLLLPFLLLASPPRRRRLRLLLGAAIAAVPLVAISVILFGPHLPNLRDQSTLLTDWSVPNIVGWVVGAGGGAPWLLRVANVALVVGVAALLRRRVQWLAGAGWATVGLLGSLAWLVPWYVIWLLPLAALSTSPRLRRAALAFTVFLVLTFMPATGMLNRSLGIDPMSSAVGQASASLQHKLAQ